ncbi:unnamed protein product [Dracunculus medinensis]|uniref:EF-hand domain-containing protein n=1 Tax=Dracunculus medinensis TaxID=318479 RepID=A0A0N4UFP0_DRAME|nr:unnamed protein product [Dracunculus medinensis]
MDRNKELTFDEFLRTDPQYELLKKQQFDAYDLNGDGIVTLKEFNSFNDEKEEKSIVNKARYYGKIFEDFDDNFDMKISLDEAKKILVERFLLKPRSNFAKLFTRFDSDADGSLNILEYVNFDRDFPFEELDPVDEASDMSTTLPLMKKLKLKPMQKIKKAGATVS